MERVDGDAKTAMSAEDGPRPSEVVDRPSDPASALGKKLDPFWAHVKAIGTPLGEQGYFNCAHCEKKMYFADVAKIQGTTHCLTRDSAYRPTACSHLDVPAASQKD